MPAPARSAPLLLALLAACGGEGKGRGDPPGPIDPLAALGAVPEVASVEERATSQAGYRAFLVAFRQPVDHAQPGGASLEQRVTLLWKDEHRPMIYATNGYMAGTNPGRSELTALLDANQLVVEHRFFGVSVPAPAALDWSRLTIAQAAADHHAIVRALRPVLGAGAWISVGASKGGMTAVYHRRFYPADVDGTLAYVAPQSFSPADEAYPPFLEAVGGATFAECRARLGDFQRALLERRAEVQPRFEAAAAAEGDGFEWFGAATAYDFSVVELSFAFWQYRSPARCAAVPAPDASAAALFDFMDEALGGVTSWIADDALALFAPYYYQSATELGGPAYPQDHLLDLLGGAPVEDLPALYPPPGEEGWDGAAAMSDVSAWVSGQGERLMFVYGEYDPWSANMFEPAEARDGWRYVLPGGNHGANVSSLPAADRAAATATLRRWAGVPAAATLTADVPEHDPRVLLTGERGAPRALRLDGSESAR